MPINKGNYTYLGEEGGGLSMAAAGNEVITLVGAVGPATYSESDISGEDYYYVAIKNCCLGSTAVQARSVAGDDFSKTGTYSHTTALSYIEIPYGDIIHGKFDKVSLEEPAGTGDVSTIRLIKGGQ